MSEPDQYTILLLMYTDELEISNPLGAARGKYKLNVKAALFCFCGDRLSLNHLGGFSGCFSSGRFCRFCLASTKQLPRLTTEQECVIRNLDAHKRHLSSILMNGIISKRLYGVTGPSPLLKLERFDVTLQLPPDIMHDILEGSFEHVLRQVLVALIQKGSLKFDDLDKVTRFPYGFHDKKNRPEPIPKSFIDGNATLRGTASQKWCLLRMFPLIFGDGVPPENPDWEVLLLFLEIANLSFSAEIAVNFVAYLQIKIQEVLCKFVSRYPQASLKPKLHFLVHCPRFIMQLGPLTQYWAMRFEAKHQVLKAVASKIKNFRNIYGTLACRHQLRQCYELQSFAFDDDLSTSCARAIEAEQVHECARQHFDTAVFSVKSASVNRCSYHIGDVIILERKDIPLFGQIDTAYLSSSRVYCVVHMFQCDGFDRHKFCYSVRPNNEHKLVCEGEEAVNCSLDIYGNSVVPKWEL
ncbi:uncharacterized protein LOC135382958 [Ornithodoros turicata]|uniref:uncharacterized protein LOC135382958 n=1 Tax=Ornithodoros turicata TaxID=34597 RepID=UPI00313951D9